MHAISTTIPTKKQANSMAAEDDDDDYEGSWRGILNLAQDHVLTILLLLPVDSILSFGMSCKRLRSICSSDTLWESLCRRDLGVGVDLDALKLQVPWMRLYKQLSLLDSVYCYKLCPNAPPADALVPVPTPRASHSINFVDDSLLLFGGGCEGGRHLDDTWVASIGVGNGNNNNFKSITPKWHKIESGIPSGRFGHSCIVIDNHIVVFGGIDDRGNRHNDTWVAQLGSSHHENNKLSLSWRLLDAATAGCSIAPPPRGAHAACCMRNRKMVIHGGMGLHGLRLADTWVLDLSENLLFGQWSEVVTHITPPARSGHTFTSIGASQALVFGGRGNGYEVLSDVWLFDMSSESDSKWEHILYQPQNIPQGCCLPRVGHSAVLMLGGWVLVYGGEDSHRNRKDDFWVLDITAIPSSSSSTRRGVVRPGKMKSMPNMWTRLEAKGYKPNSRSFHRACADSSGRYMYLFGGMVDPDAALLQPAQSPGLGFNGDLFLVELGLNL